MLLLPQPPRLHRHHRQLDKAATAVAALERKLGNENFAARAPAAVVEKERARLAERQAAQAQLAEQRARIARL